MPREFFGKVRALPLILSAAFFLICLNVGALLDATRFYAFQTRDLARALGLLHGHLIAFGPEMTGGGHLPGPLYYFLLSLALFVDPVWQSAWWLLVIVNTGAAVLGVIFFSELLGSTAALIWLALFSLSISTFSYAAFFLNVSYMVPLTLVAMLGVARAYTGSNQSRDKALILALFVVGLGCQFHATILTLLVAAVGLQIFSKASHRPSWRAFALGLCAFLLPSIPYLIWAVFQRHGQDLGQMPANAGHSEDAAGVILYLLATARAFSWSVYIYSVTAKLYSALPLMLVPLIVVWPRARHELFRPLLALTAVAFVPFSFWFISGQAYRYGMPFFIGAIALAVVLFQGILHDRQALRRYCWVSGIIFVGGWLWILLLHRSWIQPWAAVSLVAASGLFAALLGFAQAWRKESRTVLLAIFLTLGLAHFQKWSVDPAHRLRTMCFMPEYQDWQKIWSKILSQTGWSYEEAKSRMYFINQHMELDPRPSFDVFSHDVKRGLRLPHAPDGYFVSVRPYLVANFKQWLLKNPIQSDIKRELEEGSMLLGEDSGDSNIMAVPFYVSDKSKISKFHDAGEGYPVEGAGIAQEQRASSVRAEGAENVVFQWNECPTLDPYCMTGIRVALHSEAVNKYNVRAEIFGLPLAQSSAWISPGWTEAWVRPFVTVECGPEIHKFELASSIGYNAAYAEDAKIHLVTANNSILAPFERSFEFSCSSRPNRLSAGWVESQVEQIRRKVVLPGQALSFDLR